MEGASACVVHGVRVARKSCQTLPYIGVFNFKAPITARLLEDTLSCLLPVMTLRRHRLIANSQRVNCKRVAQRACCGWLTHPSISVRPLRTHSVARPKFPTNRLFYCQLRRLNYNPTMLRLRQSHAPSCKSMSCVFIIFYRPRLRRPSLPHLTTYSSSLSMLQGSTSSVRNAFGLAFRGAVSSSLSHCALSSGDDTKHVFASLALP